MGEEVVTQENRMASAAEGIFNTNPAPVVEPVVVAPVVEPVVAHPVVVAPPVTQPVVVAPPIKADIIYEEEPATSAPAFDESKWMQEKFGTTDYTTIKSRYDSYEKLQTEANELSVRLNEPKYKNKPAEVLDELLSKVGGDLNGQKEFIKNALDLLTTDTATLPAVDKVKFNLKMQYPKLTSAQIDAHISQTYMQSDEFTDEQKLAGSARLEQDASTADVQLQELKVKALANDSTRVDAVNNLNETKRQEAWKAPVQKVVEGFSNIKLNLGKINGKNASLSFEVPADIKAKYAPLLYDTMLNMGGLPNDQALEVAQGTLQAMYVQDNLDHIIQHVWNKATSDSIKSEIEQYHNPSAQGKTKANEVVEVKSRDQLIAEAMGWKGN